MSSSDMINHPPHYNSSPAKCNCGRRIECIDITRHMGFNLGNAVKYIWRYADKNGLEDLKKAAWYLNDIIEQSDKSKSATQKLPSCRHGLMDRCEECDGLEGHICYGKNVHIVE